MIKKILTFGFGILLVFTLLVGVSAFSYDEDDSGNPFYEADAKVVVPTMTVKDLVTLQPSTEPISPEVGMIYFDSDSKRLKLYDGSGWYSLALEKVSSVSKKQVKETVERKSEVQGCVASTECGDWGDCINNYESMTCVTTEEDCNKYEDSETRDCVSDFVLESSAKESHDVDETEEEIIEETESTEEDEETTGEAEEGTEEETEEVEEEIEETEEVPEELFDITFDLEEHILGESDKLVIWITLQNFGKRYVPARLIYSITDITGKEVYRKFEEIRVYTDESIIHQFDDLVLNEGDYVLTMRVEYAGIVEEFSDDFSIEKGIFGAIKRFFSGLF